MRAIRRLGAMVLSLLLAFAWPAALAQGRHGEETGRGQPHQGGQHHGQHRGEHRGGAHHGGPHYGGPHHGGPPHWRGDIGRFHEHDWGVWRAGHWRHGYHGRRAGWWWIVGPSWYYYPQPVYPYPSPWEPAELIIAAPGAVVLPPPAPYWYYCPSSRIYYPYAPVCPGGWQQVPAVPDARAPVPIPQAP